MFIRILIYSIQNVLKNKFLFEVCVRWNRLKGRYKHDLNKYNLRTNS